VSLNGGRLAAASLPRWGAYVIASGSAGTANERPRHDLNHQWRAVTKRAGLDGVRLHDLRHTYASFGAGGGLGLPIIGRLLGHRVPATTARYAHLADDPLRRAGLPQRWTARLRQALCRAPRWSR
jgi:integrase